MYLLDAKVRRRMCKKVLEMGGNAVLAYSQNFDMEGDSGLVARTFGTAVIIERRKEIVPTKRGGGGAGGPAGGGVGGGMQSINTMSPSIENQRRHQKHDESPPKDHAMMAALRQGASGGFSGKMLSLLMNEGASNAARAISARQRDDAQEVQLLTMTEFPPSVRVRIGGLVTARSVKFLGKLASKLSDQETRDGWWSELRDEIRSHARTLCCCHVIGE